jgi:hypothetical protein
VMLGAQVFGLPNVSKACLELVASGPVGRQQWHGAGGLPVLSVYCDVEKPFMG